MKIYIIPDDKPVKPPKYNSTSGFYNQNTRAIETSTGREFKLCLDGSKAGDYCKPNGYYHVELAYRDAHSQNRPVSEAFIVAIGEYKPKSGTFQNIIAKLIIEPIYQYRPSFK